ncbi:MAG: hypothetical protein IT330_06855, partial [Anaerolineae bacterium]|nr:hypothetical protein [Anaerolineae bacterium]
DELAALANAFNDMGAQLQAAATRQKEVETARRDLIAAVSHDLRTPLASIRAMAEALADGVVPDEATRQRYTVAIQREAQGLNLLIDDLFELARLDAGALKLQMERASLADLVSDTLESLSAQAAQKGVRLRGEVAPALMPVTMDAVKVQRVLVNLVQNAIRHTPADGSIAVTARPVSEGWVQIEIRDTGEGISPQDLSHVFDRFYRGDKSRSRETGGAGLGLAIAKGIVEAHGGRIWVESPSGQGAAFTFTLPAN